VTRCATGTSGAQHRRFQLNFDDRGCELARKKITKQTQFGLFDRASDGARITSASFMENSPPAL